MACGCGNAGCACIIQPGAGIAVTGSGSTTDPYVIESTISGLSQFLTVLDTPTVNLTLTGAGTVADPLLLRAASTLKLTDLKDVADPGGGPAVGESPVWTGSGADGHWEFKIPPPSPAGSTNVSNGLTGVGSVGDPVLLATSGVWGSGSLAGLGSDSTIGLAVYIDSAGKVRAAPVSAPSWASITGKPTVFTPDPAATYTVSQITDLSTNGNAAKVGGHKFTSQANSVTMPSSPSDGDIVFFPKGT
jgi:hypothetical protein